MSVQAPSQPQSKTGGYLDAFRGQYFWPSVTALAGISGGSIDQYVVNTSMPRVLAELGQPVFYAWVAAAYVLAQIVGMTVSGAWADRAGVRTPYMTAVAVFGTGSLLCALAPSMPALVVARGFQGLGGGALTALSFAACSGYPEALRIRMYSVISAQWGIVAVAGPLMGGLITDSVGWRWIFLVNAPFCLAAAAIGFRGLAGSRPSEIRRTIPVLRSVLLAMSVGFFLAAPSAQWPQLLLLLLFGLALGWAYIRSELKSVVPVIPLEAWTGRGPLGSTMLSAMLLTAAYLGANIFVPLYLQAMRGESAFSAGLVTGIGGFFWTVGSLLAAQVTGRWRMPVMLLGAWMIAAGTVGIALMATAAHVPLALVYVSWCCAATGVGLSLMHLMNWGVVYAPPGQVGATTAAVQTCRLIGGAAGGALMGATAHAVGVDPVHLPRAITASFLLAALLAVLSATVARPRLPRTEAQESPGTRTETLAAAEA